MLWPMDIQMVLLIAIWTASGVATGVLVNTALKGGKVYLVGRVLVATVGAVCVGWILHKIGYEIGGPHIGAMINGCLGGLAAMIGYFIYSNS